MNIKKLLVIIGLTALVGLILIGFYLFIYRGMLIITPQTQGASVYINKTVYTNFPAKVRLNPGTYQTTIYKDGFLPETVKYTIRPFQTLSSQVLLKEFYLVNYFDDDNFLAPVISSEGDSIYYYNFAKKVIQKIPVYYSQQDIDKINAETISPKLVITDKKIKLKIIWSSEATKAALIDGKSATIFDLTTKKIYTSNNISALTFLGETQVIYSNELGIHRSAIDFLSPVKIKDAVAIKALAVSPSKTKLAIGSTKLEIFDLAKSITTSTVNKQVSDVKWGDDNWLAISQVDGDYNQLSVVSLQERITRNLGLIAEGLFSWEDDNLVYLSKENFKPKIAKYDPSSNIKTPVYSPSMLDEPKILLIQNDKVIFSSNNGKTRLIAIKMD